MQVSTAGRADGLDGALLLDECQISLQECERLDESLALALQHLALPPGWSLLGNKLPNSNGEAVRQDFGTWIYCVLIIRSASYLVFTFFLSTNLAADLCDMQISL